MNRPGFGSKILKGFSREVTDCQRLRPFVLSHVFSL